MPGDKLTTDEKARAASAVLVDGKSSRQAAAEIGIGASSVRRAVESVRAGSDPELAERVASYRKLAVPGYLGAMAKALKALHAKLDDPAVQTYPDRLVVVLDTLDRIVERNSFGIPGEQQAAQAQEQAEVRAASARARLLRLVRGGEGQGNDAPDAAAEPAGEAAAEIAGSSEPGLEGGA